MFKYFNWWFDYHKKSSEYKVIALAVRLILKDVAAFKAFLIGMKTGYYFEGENKVFVSNSLRKAANTILQDIEI